MGFQVACEGSTGGYRSVTCEELAEPPLVVAELVDRDDKWNAYEMRDNLPNQIPEPMMTMDGRDLPASHEPRKLRGADE